LYQDKSGNPVPATEICKRCRNFASRPSKRVLLTKATATTKNQSFFCLYSFRGTDAKITATPKYDDIHIRRLYQNVALKGRAKPTRHNLHQKFVRFATKMAEFSTRANPVFGESQLLKKTNRNPTYNVFQLNFF
jgi:hypothetical protein